MSFNFSPYHLNQEQLQNAWIIEQRRLTAERQFLYPKRKAL